MLALLLSWNLALGAPVPPDEQALLALAHVHCRTADGTVWTRSPDTPGWTLSLPHRDVAEERAEMRGDDLHVVQRRVARPAARSDRPGAPWQWSEQIRIHRADGELLFDRPRPVRAVDGTFHCTDRTDPASTWVDVDVWWKLPYGEGMPAPGLRRCRSSEPDVVWIESHRFAGHAPAPGDVLSSRMLIVDGLRVGMTRAVNGEPEVPSPLVVEVVRSTPQRTSDPSLTRTLETLVFHHADGSPVLPGRPRLEVTLTCESYHYPPIPSAQPHP